MILTVWQWMVEIEIRKLGFGIIMRMRNVIYIWFYWIVSILVLGLLVAFRISCAGGDQGV